MSYGGSLIRPEATGYGAVYYLQEVLKHENDTIEGKRIAISGYGNVGWGIMKKAAELGAKVTYFAGPDGYIHDPDGVITDEKLNFILEMRAKDPMHCKPYADKFGCEFVPGEKCWGVKDVDVYMPAAMQNDVKMESAEKIAASGVKYYIEVANMPTTNDALNFLREQKDIIVAPSKAVNAGGVGVSALEMAQNSERLVWTAEEVDAQLHKMMKNIHKVSAEAAAEYGLGYDLVAGANIAASRRLLRPCTSRACSNLFSFHTQQPTRPLGLFLHCCIFCDMLAINLNLRRFHNEKSDHWRSHVYDRRCISLYIVGRSYGLSI